MNTTVNDPAEKRPWYRQFWPWFIIALPAAAVVAGVTTVGIAFTYQDSLVRDDWYKEGKAINQSLERDARATRLGLAADVRIDSVSGDVSVRLQQAARDFAPPPRLTLYFSHPTKASADQAVMLTRRDHQYFGHLTEALQGRFYVELGTPEWRLMGSHEFPQAEFSLSHD